MKEKLERTRTLFLALAAVMIGGNLLYIDRNFAAIPRLGESARVLLYALPTIIGLVLAGASIGLGEYGAGGNLRRAVRGVLGGLFVVGCIILLRLLLGPNGGRS